MNKTRRNFLQTSLLLGAGSAFLSACGDDDGGTDTGPIGDADGGTDSGPIGDADGGPVETDGGPAETDSGPVEADGGPVETDAGPVETDAGPVASCEGTSSTIGSNHGHVIEVPAADVAAGVEVTYDIQGESRHAHSLTVTGEDFAALASGSITISSSMGQGHTHDVMIVCAAA